MRHGWIIVGLVAALVAWDISADRGALTKPLLYAAGDVFMHMARML